MGDIEAFILAGGKSSRMGKDKGLIPIFGKPMVKHLLDKIEDLGIEASIISSNPEYQIFKKPVYQDVVPNIGPLGGLLTSLSFAKKRKILILSCDTPLIPIIALQKLLENTQEAEICITEAEGNLNPLFGIYPKSILSKVRNQIEKGDLKMKNFIFDNPHTILNMDYIATQDSLSFTNFNTVQDLQQIGRVEKKSINTISTTKETSKW